MVRYDLEFWIGDKTGWPLSVEDTIDEAAWLEIERKGWAATPELYFALKEVIRDEMMGG